MARAWLPRPGATPLTAATAPLATRKGADTDQVRGHALPKATSVVRPDDERGPVHASDIRVVCLDLYVPNREAVLEYRYCLVDQ